MIMSHNRVGGQGMIVQLELIYSSIDKRPYRSVLKPLTSNTRIEGRSRVTSGMRQSAFQIAVHVYS